jgi:hypothetical protein
VCFEFIDPANNPTLLCKSCGTVNKPEPAVPKNAPASAPPPPKPKPKRKWATTAEKVVLCFLVVPIVVLVAGASIEPRLKVQLPTDIAILTVSVLVYFAPSLFGKAKRNANAILALNVFLGWTLVGWVVALVWAITKESGEEPTEATHIRCPDCAELVRKEARVCKHCGAKLTPELSA